MKFFNLLFLTFTTLFLIGCSGVETLSNTASLADPTGMEVGLLDEPTKEVFIDAFSYGYSVPEIKVKKNQRVRIYLSSSDGFHDFVIDELNVASKKLNTGESINFEFTARNVGEFEYYCSIGNHRSQGMVGKIIIEE